MLEISTAPTTTAKRPPGILSLIGDTPLVEVTQIDTGPCKLFLKLENQNPTGSIKDRVALTMIEAAEREGKLQAGGVVIEATAGNTGLGLALVAGAKGYRVILVIPDKMSREKNCTSRRSGPKWSWRALMLRAVIPNIIKTLPPVWPRKFRVAFM